MAGFFTEDFSNAFAGGSKRTVTSESPPSTIGTLIWLISSIILFFNDTATTETYPLSLHDALPIYDDPRANAAGEALGAVLEGNFAHIDAHYRRSEEHTSELQSHSDLVCRLLL